MPNSSAIDSRPSQINFSTVAIVAASDDVPLTAFTYELYHCLSAIGKYDYFNVHFLVVIFLIGIRICRFINDKETPLNFQNSFNCQFVIA